MSRAMVSTMWKSMRHPARIACAAAVLVACGSDGPRWAKRADQIDIARWQEVCGTARDSFDDDTGDVQFHEEYFSRPSPTQPTPKLPEVQCSFARQIHGQRLLRADIRIVGTPVQVSPALRQSALGLLEELLPTSVHSTLRDVAASTPVVRRASHGFDFRGGEAAGAVAGDIEWTIAVGEGI